MDSLAKTLNITELPLFNFSINSDRHKSNNAAYDSDMAMRKLRAKSARHENTRVNDRSVTRWRKETDRVDGIASVSQIEGDARIHATHFPKITPLCTNLSVHGFVQVVDRKCAKRILEECAA